VAGILCAPPVTKGIDSMRKHYVIGNWKMNLSSQSISELVSNIELEDNVVVGVTPPAPYIPLVDSKRAKGLWLGAQNVSKYVQGAYTGDVSAAMMADVGVEFALAGHSERRHVFGDNNQDVADKVNVLLQNGITAIVCCGESLDQYNDGTAKKAIRAQLTPVLENLNDLEQIIVAYEPVWAIGTGLTATPEIAQDMHAFIRTVLAEYFDVDAAAKVSILYGGSVTAKNASELFEGHDVDGALIGGASLKADDFNQIIKAKG